MNRLYIALVQRPDFTAVLPFLLPFFAIPALTPFLQQGFSATVDGMLHLLRLVLLHHHIGCTFTALRWTPELYLGYGYPLFNFYAPGSYYLTNLVHCAGIPLPQSILLVLSGIVIFAGYGAYWFAYALLQGSERPVRALGALLAAVAYMYNPYFLMNIHARTAIPESLAQALLPWVLYSFWQLVDAPTPLHWIWLAVLSLGGLAITHNITLLLATPFLVCYLGFLLWQNRTNGAIKPQRLMPIVFAGMAAVGISAFFWLPLIGERQYLSSFTLGISRYFMSKGGWDWNSILDFHWPFYYRIGFSYSLGIAQLGLGLGGLVPLLRRAPIWRFWAIVAFLCCLGIGKFTLPLWESHPILLIPQFPWRLLILASLPISLFVAGFIFYFEQRWLRWLTGVIVLLLCVWGNFPRISLELNDIDRLKAAPENIDVAAANLFEFDSLAWGTGSAREFLPTWAGDTIFHPVPVEPAVLEKQNIEVTVRSASPFHLILNVHSELRQAIHFTNFYFPGWQAKINDIAVPAYPEPSKGLLSVDLPAGNSVVDIRWEDTKLQQIGNWLSLGTLLALAIAAILWPRLPGWQKLSGVGALVFGLIIYLPSGQRVAAQEIQPIIEPATTPSAIQLVAFTSSISKNQNLNLFPYWFVYQSGSRLRMHWRLLDDKQTVVSETISEPYFDTVRSDSWLPNSFVDDAYQMGLPYELSAGRYHLQLQIEQLDQDGETLQMLPIQPVGEIDLPTIAIPSPQIAEPLDIRFGDRITSTEIALKGWQVSINQVVQPSSTDQIVVAPGDQLEYDLYWQSLGLIRGNHHSFFHLLDWFQQPVLKRDQLPGTFLYPPLAWNSQRVQSDSFTLTLPKTLAGGLYKPLIGLYRFPDGHLFNAFDRAEQKLDNVFLPTIKVARFDKPSPGKQTFAQIDPFAQIAGYDLSPQPALKAGSSLTVTLYYHGLQPVQTSYVRFVHLYAETLGMAAQFDSIPQEGTNPTSSWVSGEWVYDSVVLSIPADAPPGTYDLFVGFYDAQSQVRVPLLDQGSNPFVDAQLRLSTVQVE